MNQCLNCNKDLIKSQKKYCSSKCQSEYKFKLKINAWKNGEFNGLVGQSELSDYIRKYLLIKTNYTCELCGWGEKNIYTNSIPLEIHHIDGDYKNNQENNLQVLCPNCHSLTENYRGANKNKGRDDRLLKVPRRKNYCPDCGKEILQESSYCKSCSAKHVHTKDIPVTRQELKNLIRTTTFISIGKQYGVSDNAIRKWCKKYNLPFRVKDIKQITDMDWEKI